MADPPTPTEAAFWTYRARPDPLSDHSHGVVDGDTLDLQFDTGMANLQRERVRLDGVDTAEIYGTAEGTDEHATGDAQAQYVAEWLAEAGADWSGTWPLVVRTLKDDTGKYGRLLGAAVVRRSDDRHLTTTLVGRWPSADD